jgi:hypothetical protein
MLQQREEAFTKLEADINADAETGLRNGITPLISWTNGWP